MDFNYVGYTTDKQVVKGRITANNEQVAADMLANVGYQVINLKPVVPFLPNIEKLFPGRVKAEEITTFSRQLALLLESGVGIVRSLELLQSQTENKTLDKTLIEITTDLRSGSSLSKAMAKHHTVFSPMYSKIVNVGEQTGGLEEVLRSLADYAERETTTINKLKTALTYPAIVFGLGIIVMIILVLFLLPPIVDLFSSLGGDLPLPTRILLGSTVFLNSYGLYVLIALAGLGVAGYFYTRSDNGRYQRDKLILKLPLIGRLTQLTELARCCRSMSLLFKAGLPLPEIMTSTSQACGNIVVSQAIHSVEQDMLKGEGLAGPMRKNRVFLPLMVEMTKVGEETGNLDGTLVTVAQTYEVEADAKIQRLLSMIEPVMTIVLGIGVGFIAISVFMPIYSSLSLVGG